jgi:diguanylate cyclase (GGDEF)-like protein/PAS domain S-box-containing protein
MDHELFAAAFAQAPAGIAVVAPGGRLLHVNDAFCRLFGHQRADLVGRSFAELVHPEDADAAQRAVARLTMGAAEGYEAERRHVRATGEVIWLSVSAAALHAPDGAVTAVVAHLTDVSELRRLADNDVLTGLLNRRGFERELEQKLRLGRRYGWEGALLVLDLDRFKIVNDTRGHAAGDDVIAAVADAMRSSLRSSDVISRLGGDEFAVLLPRGGAEEAREVAGKLGEAFLTVGVTASMGIAPLGDAHPTSESILAAADRAMYDAKQAGRGRVALLT